jgi:hypothetical protein
MFNRLEVLRHASLSGLSKNLMAKVFTMFPCGWPRRALLLLRLGIVAILTQDGILGWVARRSVNRFAAYSRCHLRCFSARRFVDAGCRHDCGVERDLDRSQWHHSPADPYPPGDARYNPRISGTGLSLEDFNSGQ